MECAMVDVPDERSKKSIGRNKNLQKGKGNAAHFFGYPYYRPISWNCMRRERKIFKADICVNRKFIRKVYKKAIEWSAKMKSRAEQHKKENLFTSELAARSLPRVDQTVQILRAREQNTFMKPNPSGFETHASDKKCGTTVGDIEMQQGYAAARIQELEPMIQLLEAREQNNLHEAAKSAQSLRTMECETVDVPDERSKKSIGRNKNLQKGKGKYRPFLWNYMRLERKMLKADILENLKFFNKVYKEVMECSTEMKSRAEQHKKECLLTSELTATNLPRTNLTVQIFKAREQNTFMNPSPSGFETHASDKKCGTTVGDIEMQQGYAAAKIQELERMVQILKAREQNNLHEAAKSAQSLRIATHATDYKCGTTEPDLEMLKKECMMKENSESDH